MPPSAQAQTPQAAAAFARFFYAEIGKAFGERDPARVEALSDPTCEACRLFIDSIAELRDKNQRVTPVNFEIVLAEAPGLEGEQARVDVIYNLAPVQTTDASGKQIAEDPGAQNREVQLTLVRAGTSWLVKAAEAV